MVALSSIGPSSIQVVTSSHCKLVVLWTLLCSLNARIPKRNVESDGTHRSCALVLTNHCKLAPILCLLIDVSANKFKKCICFKVVVLINCYYNKTNTNVSEIKPRRYLFLLKIKYILKNYFSSIWTPPQGITNYSYSISSFVFAVLYE